MRLPRTLRRLAGTAVLVLLASHEAFSQEGPTPLPYSDDEEEQPTEAKPPTNRRPLPRRSRRQMEQEEEERKSEHLVEDREERLGHLDDPNKGLGAHLVGGLLLHESSRGAGTESRFLMGARVDWEYGRMFASEAVHDLLFVDVLWAYMGKRDGTEQYFAEANYHFVSAAPGFAYYLPAVEWLAVYGQVGGGIIYQSSSLHAPRHTENVRGIKPLFQYGFGVKGRPPANADGTIRLTFRLELTRLRRGYMDDTLLAVSAGAAF